jgi:hypothetical protein
MVEVETQAYTGFVPEEGKKFDDFGGCWTSTRKLETARSDFDKFTFVVSDKDKVFVLELDSQKVVQDSWTLEEWDFGAYFEDLGLPEGF